MTYKDIKDIVFTLPSERKSQLDAMKEQDNIVGFSGGKDSMATAIILRWLEIPFSTLTAEVWWKEGITGENPYHYDFLHRTALPTIRSWGVETNVVRSKTTAFEFMTTPITKSKYPERIGKLRGFPLCGKCGIQRDCKTRPCERFYKERNSARPIWGLASNEKDRVLSASAKRVSSVLDLLGIEEWRAFPICIGEGLLSPSYKFTDRGGCWFCPNQKIQEWEVLYTHFPELWAGLKSVQDMPNKIQENITRRETLHDIERQILHGVQGKIFMGDIFGGRTDDEQAH